MVKKVYAKKTVYDWGVFFFFETLFFLMIIGQIFSRDVGVRIGIGVMLFLLSIVVVGGLIIQASTEKKVEIGYIEEEKK